MDEKINIILKNCELYKKFGDPNINSNNKKYCIGFEDSNFWLPTIHKKCLSCEIFIRNVKWWSYF